MKLPTSKAKPILQRIDEASKNMEIKPIGVRSKDGKRRIYKAVRFLHQHPFENTKQIIFTIGTISAAVDEKGVPVGDWRIHPVSDETWRFGRLESQSYASEDAIIRDIIVTYWAKDHFLCNITEEREIPFECPSVVTRVYNIKWLSLTAPSSGPHADVYLIANIELMHLKNQGGKWVAKKEACDAIIDLENEYIMIKGEINPIANYEFVVAQVSTNLEEWMHELY